MEGVTEPGEATVASLSWRRSTRCDSSACVEVAAVGADRVAVRDSKDADGGYLLFPGAAWSRFLDAVRRGEFG